MSGAPEGIPRRIIQTGKTRALPLLEQASLAGMMALNPGFEHCYFTDPEVEAFVDREFPEYRPVFDAFPHKIQRFDFFRYLAVYRLGGFYFDLDVFLARGLADLCAAECVFPFEELTLSRFLRQRHGLDWEIGNYAFGARAGHPFLRAIIDNCVRAQREPEWAAPMLRDIPALFRGGFQVLNTTGPGLITRTLAENRALAPHVTVLFPEDVRDERSWHKFGGYGVHLMAASWRDRGSFVRRRLARWWESRRRRAAAAESRQAGPRRTFPPADAA
jgi:inositol phosphorylceramide mannosyltransferase catalytic subunit